MRRMDLIERWRERVRRLWAPRSLPVRPLEPVLGQAHAFIREFLSANPNPQTTGDQDHGLV